ncbi:porin [Ottowia sp. GY511]|uniref:Porin n=1 Tax=Ottowia flava TaxID=2675430 RepID=A0ABW4KWJ1_9BURK|nr:porin [Ottowia sp. GY511]TXK23548.1 porin [Ottowia sp. GY511]
MNPNEETMVTKVIWKAVAVAMIGTGGAMAQGSNVTMYGIVDAAVEHQGGVASGDATRMRSGGLSGGRFGLRGNEDLGGGMRAVFTLESGVEVDKGAASDPARFWNRQAYVGIGGRWGELTLGRQYTGSFLVLTGYMPKHFALLYEPVGTVTTSRVNSSFVYDGKFDAFRVRAHASMKSSLPGGAGATHGVGVSYALGNGSIAAYYDSVDGDLTDNGRSRRRLFGVAAKYKWEDLTFVGGWRKTKADTDLGRIALRDRFWWLGVAYRVTPATELSVAYYRNDIRQRGPATDIRAPQQLSLWLMHNLSKRTTLYAAAAHSRHAPLNFGFGGYTLADSKRSQTGVAMGIRHTF